ncbi:hypothetical protein HYX14_01410 [Candidatus Woesearchaeota archaeon]|nr:hypothetical protein [Candidatus Woesearchaeota archaeon]
MLVFGVDVPLVEVVVGLVIISFILFIEAIVIIILLLKHQNKSKEVTVLQQRMAETLLDLKRAEVDVLDKVRGK